MKNNTIIKNKLTKNAPIIYITIAVIILIVGLFLYFRYPKTEMFEGMPNLSYYYLPSCGWCKKFNPVWEEFTIEVDNKKVPVKPVKIDGSDEKNKPILEKFSINGFPHIQLEKGNDVVVFEGERTVESLMDFIKKNI